MGATAIPSKWFRGWTVILSTMFVIFSCGAIAYAGAYTVSLMKLQTNMDQAVVGFYTSIISGTIAASAFPLGLLIPKIGAKKLMLAGVALACLALAILTFAPANAYLLLVCGAMCAFGITCTAKMGGPYLVTYWFDKNRSLPMSLIIACGSLGGFLSSFIAIANKSMGYRAGWGLLLILNAIGLLLILLFTHEDRDKVGEVRDGRRWHELHGTASEEKAEAKSAIKEKKGEADKFWNFTYGLFCLTCCLRMFAYNAALAYSTLYIVSKGFTPAQAAVAMGSLTMAGVVGRLSGPLWSNVLRLSDSNMNRLSFIFVGLGGLLLMFGSTIPVMAFAIALIGFGYGLGYVSQTLVLGRWYNDVTFVKAFGPLTSLIAAFGFLSPIVTAGVYKVTGTYSLVYMAVGIICLLCAVPGFKNSGIKETAQVSSLSVS